MPAKIDRDTRREIVCLRALDYTKQEIASEVGVSRNTVRRHLEDIRDELEGAENLNAALAEFLLTPEEFTRYAFDEQRRSFQKEIDRHVQSSLHAMGFVPDDEEQDR